LATVLLPLHTISVAKEEVPVPVALDVIEEDDDDDDFDLEIDLIGDDDGRKNCQEFYIGLGPFVLFFA
jgi:hypothetical protein